MLNRAHFSFISRQRKSHKTTERDLQAIKRFSPQVTHTSSLNGEEERNSFRDK